MREFTKDRPKCLVEISPGVSILKSQIENLNLAGIKDIYITTGYKDDEIRNFIHENYKSSPKFTFIFNPLFSSTNYIFSLKMCFPLVDDDIILVHGDLVFSTEVVSKMILSENSCVAVDFQSPIPEKDFKASVHQGRVTRISTLIFGSDCYSCQPIYHLKKNDWDAWAQSIIDFCEKGLTNVYAEEALNSILEKIPLFPFDLNGEICMEIDTPEDLRILQIRKSGLQ